MACAYWRGMDGNIRQTEKNRERNYFLSYGVFAWSWKRNSYHGKPRRGLIKMDNIVIGIFGLKGSGKTLLMVALLYLEHQAGKKILVNMNGLNFPSELLNIRDIVNLSDKISGCTVGLDELHTIADSRKSTRKQNIQISNFFLQSRHRGVNIIYTEQYSSTDDKRIRQNTDIKIIAKNLYIDSDNDGIPDIFEYVIIDTKTEDIKTIRIYGAQVFKLYSDVEIIDLYEHKEKK